MWNSNVSPLAFLTSTIWREGATWNIWPMARVSKRYMIDSDLSYKFNRIVVYLCGNIKVSLSPSFHVFQPQLRKQGTNQKVWNLNSSIQKLNVTCMNSNLVVFLLYVKTKGLCSFLNFMNYLVSRAFRCEPCFSLKTLQIVGKFWNLKRKEKNKQTNKQ